MNLLVVYLLPSWLDEKKRCAYLRVHKATIYKTLKNINENIIVTRLYICIYYISISNILMLKKKLNAVTRRPVNRFFCYRKIVSDYIPFDKKTFATGG